MYFGLGTAANTAHGTNWCYSFNLDILNNKKIKLNQLINIDSSLLNIFKKTINENFPFVIRQYIKEISDEEIIVKLKSSDSLELEIQNQYDVFSCFTEDKIYISFPTIYAIGNYIIVELNITPDLKLSSPY